MSERRERPAIGWDRIVGEVASHYLAQPLSLFGYRLVHPTLQLYLDVLQLTPHAVASGLPLKHESAAARSSTDESEAQEGERFRLSKPAPLSIGRCKAAKLVAYLLSQPAFTGYAWHLTGRGDVASGLWLRSRRAGPR
jgi:hypothetical protein